MRQLCALLVVLLSGSWSFAGGPTLKEARQRLLKGNYAEARELYTALAKEAKHHVPATIGLSRAMESEGDYDEAMKTIETAVKELPRNADLLGRRAELLYLRGRWDEAEKTAAAALAIKEDHFPARWVQGQVYRDRGEIDKADEEFRWFVRTYTQRANADMEITDPDDLITVGLAGSERARWHQLAEQFRFILNEIYAETVKQDKDFWWGEYYAGRLYLEKYNKADAGKSFDRALVINARAAEVLASKGIIAFQRFDIKDAELYAQQALKINPSLTEALRLQADGRWPASRLLSTHRGSTMPLPTWSRKSRSTIRRRPFSTTNSPNASKSAAVTTWPRSIWNCRSSCSRSCRGLPTPSACCTCGSARKTRPRRSSKRRSRMTPSTSASATR
jgi:tetratricopeptide (TPR) repeat protein